MKIGINNSTHVVLNSGSEVFNFVLLFYSIKKVMCVCELYRLVIDHDGQLVISYFFK